LRRRIDADDVVQSTYRSFFTHAEQGDYALAESGDLWRLLASIALHKLYGQVERHTAGRRSINHETVADDALPHRTAALEPSAAEVIAISEQLQLITRRLSDEQRTLLVAYLRGDSADKIAAQFQKSPRTIRRLLAQLRGEFEQELLPDEPAANQLGLGELAAASSLAPLAYKDFVIERLIGAGGMGKVYRALDRNTGQPVAIKTLRKSRQHDRLVVEKFLQEAEILSRLHHPNIVAFQGVGRFPGGGYFIAMEFIDGTNLQTLIARRPPKIADAVQMVRTVANAIAYAHANGIVHGDLKPANVLVDSTNRLVVSDFGLAQFINMPPTTRPWLVGGTAGFIAPEVRDDRSVPTPAADVFGLGALLTALLAAADRRGRDSLGAIDEKTGKLSAICAKCLATNPQDRYPSVEEFIAALDS
jgi:DNA-directed RNA polymerase specialized sigma24 family protein/predicted Ser/Thr protein kinase